MRNTNYTSIYLSGFSRLKTILTEAVLEEQNLNSLFNNAVDLYDLIDAATEDQLRFIFYKIKNDLPDGSVTAFVNKCIEATKDRNYQSASSEIVNLLKSNYNVEVDISDTKNVVKLYRAFQVPADLSNPPSFLRNFGAPYVSPTTPDAPTDTTTPDPTADSTGSAADAITPAPAPAPQPGDVPSTPPPGPGTPTNIPSNREAAARGEQLRRGSSYRQGARSSQDAVRPISPAGGPTYYIRTSPGRYRPAVQADMNANIPLYIKNPNPLAAVVNPYVRVSDEVKRARRAGPVDQQAIDREMKASVGGQRIGPGGLRYEKGGRVERKSKLPGVAGSLSNFFGDVGNTLTGR